MDAAVDLGREALVLALELSAPLLLTALVVGAAAGLLQAVTQMQESTLSFVPKLVAVIAVGVAVLPWMIQLSVGYMERVFGQLPYVR